MPLWRKGPKASAARTRGWLRVSRTIETMSRWGGPLGKAWDDSQVRLSGLVPDLAEILDEIAEAARRGLTLVTTQARASTSAPLLERMGFETKYLFDSFNAPTGAR